MEHTGLVSSSDLCADIVQSIHDEAVFIGLNLPGYVVDQIREFALSEPLHAIYDQPGRRSNTLTSKVASTESWRKPCRLVASPSPERCSAVQKVIDDPILPVIGGSHLGEAEDSDHTGHSLHQP